jgi:thioredoxin 1
MENVLTDANFNAEVLQSPVPIIVDFWAPWCGPCRVMSPIVDEIAGEIDPGSLKLGKLNVDDNPVTAQAYGIMSIPTFLVFKGGQVVEQMVGSMDKAAFKERLMKHVA